MVTYPELCIKAGESPLEYSPLLTGSSSFKFNWAIWDSAGVLDHPNAVEGKDSPVFVPSMEASLDTDCCGVTSSRFK